MRNRVINEKHDLIVPEVIADWDAPSHWERERFDSMEKHLSKGMILFDVGVEHGWMSAVMAKYFVGGGENMVLLEPSPEFWPNIRATWEANRLRPPRLTSCQLIGNDSSHPSAVIIPNGWPEESKGKILDRSMPYRYLHEHKDTPRINIDSIVEGGGVVPDAMTIDVEGAELEVLEGAKETLNTHKPLVWVSIHPSLMERDYKASPSMVHRFMEQLGYKSEHLGTDHEEHWFFHV